MYLKYFIIKKGQISHLDTPVFSLMKIFIKYLMTLNYIEEFHKDYEQCWILDFHFQQNLQLSWQNSTEFQPEFMIQNISGFQNLK